MRHTVAIAPTLANILRENNFKRKGNVFLRITGDGILQCIFASKDSSLISDVHSSLSVSVRSIYEPEVFGDVKIYRGALTYPYSLFDFRRNEGFIDSAEELLTRCCLPRLDQTMSQESFCDLLYSMDMKCFGEVRWYIKMLMIPALMRTGNHELALEYCDYVLLHNSALPRVIHMKKLLLQEDASVVEMYLKHTQLRNWEVYNHLKFR